MAVTNVYGLYGVSLSTAANSLLPVSSTRLPLNTEVRGESGGGEPYVRFHSVVGQKIVPTFSTRKIAGLFNLITAQGKRIDDLTGNKMVLYGQKFLEGGTRDATNVHRSYTLERGLIVPRTLSCGYQGDAMCSVDVHVVYDGSNDPVVIGEGQAVPAPSVAAYDDERFTIGKVVLETLTFSHVRNIEIDFGLQPETIGADSDIWESFSHLRMINPKITLRGVDLQWFKSATPANVPILGKNLTHASTSIYLRKRAAGGGLVADNVGQHIKFTACGMAVIEDALNADGTEAHECSLCIYCKFDGTNMPLVINPASTIP